jgi:hypothetical protein
MSSLTKVQRAPSLNGVDNGMYCEILDDFAPSHEGLLIGEMLCVARELCAPRTSL